MARDNYHEGRLKLSRALRNYEQSKSTLHARTAIAALRAQAAAIEKTLAPPPTPKEMAARRAQCEEWLRDLA